MVEEPLDGRDKVTHLEWLALKRVESGVRCRSAVITDALITMKGPPRDSRLEANGTPADSISI